MTVLPEMQRKFRARVFSMAVYKHSTEAETDVAKPADVSLTGETCPEEKEKTNKLENWWSKTPTDYGSVFT